MMKMVCYFAISLIIILLCLYFWKISGGFLASLVGGGIVVTALYLSVRPVLKQDNYEEPEEYKGDKDFYDSDW